MVATFVVVDERLGIGFGATNLCWRWRWLWRAYRSRAGVATGVGMALSF